MNQNQSPPCFVFSIKNESTPTALALRNIPWVSATIFVIGKENFNQAS